MAERLPAPAVTLMSDGQVITGGVVSIYVSMVVHELLKPDALVTVVVTRYGPGLPSIVPGTGYCVMVKAPEGVQLSVATTSPLMSGIMP